MKALMCTFFLSSGKLLVVMHLSTSCPTPHPRGWWGNTGDLTNRGVKFPTTGAKLAVKSPLCPHSLVGDLTTPQG